MVKQADKNDSRLVGVAAAALSMGFTELLATSVRPNPGPVEAVSTRVVAYAPSWFVELGKTLFGLSDKIALLLGTAVLTLWLGAMLGRWARQQMRWSLVGIAAIQAIGFLAMLADDNGEPGASVFLFLTGTTVAIIVFVVMMGLITPVPTSLRPAPSSDPPTPSENLAQSTRHGLNDVQKQAPLSTPAPVSPTKPPVARRTFIAAAGVIGASGVLMGVGGSAVRSSGGNSSSARSVTFPVSPDSDRIEGLIELAESSPVARTPNISPAVVPTNDFYRIDTSLFVPNIDSRDWTLTIDGMVSNPLTISYPELVAMATEVAPVTLSCVSNDVGGPLVGNAIWQGVPLRQLLDEAGIDPNATQVASYADNWSCGFPTAAIDDSRTALVAVGMNGEPLRDVHGFPARLVVSGLYGYVSATKWLRRIELTTLEDFGGFWTTKGWSKLAPVKTQARIDRPRSGEELDGSQLVDIAGVAWAPNIGVEKVEVQIDTEPWIETELGESLGSDAWRQWRTRWNPTPGDHVVRVRTTSNDGEVQTERNTDVAPDGASGYHTVNFFVI